MSGSFKEMVLPYVKSPVASGCLACSSVRNRVRVTMSMLTFSCVAARTPLLVPLVAMIVDG